MLKIYLGNDCIHDPDNPEQTRTNPITDEDEWYTFLVYNISLTRKVNEPDSLEFVIADTHYNSNDIYPNCAEIRVDKYDMSESEPQAESIFYGRVLSTSINLQGERTITCESELGYLYDSIIPPFLLQNVQISEALTYILEQHNAQIETSGTGKISKQIVFPSGGNVAPYLPKYDVDGNGFVFAADGRLIIADAQKILSLYQGDAASAQRRLVLGGKIENVSADLDTTVSRVTWSSDGTERALDIIKRCLTDVYGGVLKIVHTGNQRVLSYKQINGGSAPNESCPRVDIGSNILDITCDKTAEDRFTMLYPLGAEITQTDSLYVKALRNKTWLAFGDSLSTCLLSNNAPTIDIHAQDPEDFSKLEIGEIGRIYSTTDDYTGSYAVENNSLVLKQKNKYTYSEKSYINLLTEQAGMRTITMAQDTETIFKHGGHTESSVKKQDWASNGSISTNRDKSVVERLYDMFGPAEILDIQEEVEYGESTNTKRKVTSGVALGMRLESDSSWYTPSEDHIITRKEIEDHISGVRKCDFVTVAVGLNDWLNADSILGTNEMARKYSHLIDGDHLETKAHFTASDLFSWATSNAIDDYMRGERKDELGKYDEDGKRVMFKKTLYWQIRYMCMYLKACFPISHIIIFSSFGSKKQKSTEHDPTGTGASNKVGTHGWYVPDGVSTRREWKTFYNVSETENYMKDTTINKSGTEPNKPSGEWADVTPSQGELPPSPEQYDIIQIGNKYYQKVHIEGRYSKTSKTTYVITPEGLNPNKENLSTDEKEEYYAYSKVSRQEVVPSSGSSGNGVVDVSVAQPGDNDANTETPSGESSEPQKESKPHLFYAKQWNTADENCVGHLDSETPSADAAHTDFENAPEIICNPYDVLLENSYSISDLNSAINEVCDELGIVFVDSSQSAGISVDNFADITIDQQDSTKANATVIPYNNLGQTVSGANARQGGTKTGIWGESFTDGEHLNDRGQKAMARAVRNAMLDCLTADGSIDTIERLSIKGTKTTRYYEPIVYDADSLNAGVPDNWRAFRVDAAGELLKLNGVYDLTGQVGRKAKYSDYTDKSGYGKYDLIDLYGDYNPRAFETYDFITTGEDKNFERNAEKTAELIPNVPADPIVATVQFDDITDPTELFYAGGAYLAANHSENVINITVKAIDMHIVNSDITEMKPGNIAKVTAINYGLMDSTFVIDSITESDDPADTIISMKSVGSSKTAKEQLAANPYGSYGSRTADKVRLAFSRFSEIYNAMTSFTDYIGGK